jgi:hypothetical protein
LVSKSPAKKKKKKKNRISFEHQLNSHMRTPPGQCRTTFH